MEPKPHAVFIPYPAQGHINPMLKLAKLLYAKGFYITFVNAQHFHDRLLKANGSDALDGLPSFRFEALPDVLDPNSQDIYTDQRQNIVKLFGWVAEGHYVEPLRDLLARTNEAAANGVGGVPPVSCLVSDGFMDLALGVAEELGIAQLVGWPASASCLMAMAQFDKLMEMGIIPFKDDDYMTNGQLDTVLPWIEGANDIRLRDMPTFIRTTDPNGYQVRYFIRMIDNIKKASAIVFNSFDELEHDALQSLCSFNFPPLYASGPFQLLLDSVEDENTKNIRSSVWKEDIECITWLDSQSTRSILYVNFGSVTWMTKDQLIEFAWGLIDSKHPFLWIIRPDMIVDGTPDLPSEILSETTKRGLITTWCNQEQVLAHPAVALFLTHNGWNSTMESIYNGVPMICWPFIADQTTNCWYCCMKWKIGVEIHMDVKRSFIESTVKEVIEGEKGKEMAKNAMEFMRLAREATVPFKGSSYSNLENAVRSTLELISHSKKQIINEPIEFD